MSTCIISFIIIIAWIYQRRANCANFLVLNGKSGKKLWNIKPQTMANYPWKKGGCINWCAKSIWISRPDNNKWMKLYYRIVNIVIIISIGIVIIMQCLRHQTKRMTMVCNRKSPFRVDSMYQTCLISIEIWNDYYFSVQQVRLIPAHVTTESIFGNRAMWQFHCMAVSSTNRYMCSNHSNR